MYYEKTLKQTTLNIEKKSDSDIPTALILMVSSRPCAFFLQETWLQRMLSPSLTLMWMRLSNRKTTDKSKCQVELFEILKSKCLKIWIWNQKRPSAATFPLLLEASWKGNQPTSFTINTTFKGHEHRCDIVIWWFGYVYIYQNHLQMFWKCMFEICMDVDGISD